MSISEQFGKEGSQDSDEDSDEQADEDDEDEEEEEDIDAVIEAEMLEEEDDEEEEEEEETEEEATDRIRLDLAETYDTEIEEVAAIQVWMQNPLIDLLFPRFWPNSFKGPVKRMTSLSIFAIGFLFGCVLRARGWFGTVSVCFNVFYFLSHRIQRNV